MNPATGAAVILTQHPVGNVDFAQVYDGLTWSPNGATIAASAFAYDPGGSFGLARVVLVTLANARTVDSVDFATNPDWGKSNRLLFEGYDLLEDDREWGIWDARMTSQHPATNPIILGSLSWADESPVWAPDGRHFVTIRSTAGSRLAGGSWTTNEALMLFDRANPKDGRMILLADHGYLDDPAWSPDGRYIVYTLRTDRGSDVWWLDALTGATGPLTRNGHSFDADWRPR